MAKRPKPAGDATSKPKRRSHKRAPADDVQPDAERVQSICTAGPLDNMPDGDEDDEDEGDVMGDGD